MKPRFAYLPGQFRTLLLADAQFNEALLGGSVSCKFVPDPLVKPHVLIQAVGNNGADPLLRKVMIQVTPFVPDDDVLVRAGIEDPADLVAWNLAVRAGEVLGRAKNVVIDDDTAFSASWLEGPIQQYDTERGADRPIFYAPCRFMAHVRKRAKS